MEKIKALICILVVVFTFSSCGNKDDDSKPYEGEVEFEFENVVDGDDIQLNTKNYTNANGDIYTISALRYWVSNIKFKNKDGSTWQAPNSYFLIENTSSKTRTSFSIEDVPFGEYTDVEFSIGVDDERNHSLDKKAGELSEAVGMSWTWNTGYVFFKIEGMVNLSGSKADFRHDIGSAVNYKTITSNIPQSLIIEKGREAEIHIRADIDNVYNTPNKINIKNTLLIEGGGADSEKISANYGTSVFKLAHIHNDK